MASDVLQLKPSEVYEFITAALTCKHVPYIAGPPGIGKSQIVKQVAKDANAYMIDLRLSQILSEDMTGLPERDHDTGKAVYLPFETFPLQGDKIPEGYNGWLLFLDELSSASEEVLAASYSLILDRTVGGKKLHDKVLIVAAGNRASDSAIARELPDTLITRMLPIEMTINHKDWLMWALREDTKSNEAVVSFIQRNPDMLYANVKAESRQELETYPTPRGWEKVFDHMNFHEKQASSKVKEDSNGLPSKDNQKVEEPVSTLVFNLMTAAIGIKAARAFREDYDDAIKVPYPWECAQSPSSMRIPNKNTSKVKLIGDLSKFWIESDEQTRDSLLIYVNRIGGEYSELFMNQIKQSLGTSPSDLRLIEKTESRLGIDPLLGKSKGSKGDLGIDSDVPF